MTTPESTPAPAGCPALVSFGERIHRLAVEKPSEVAVIFAAADGVVSQHTRSEIDDRSTQLARVLARHGVGVGERVAIGLRNSPEFVIGCFAGSQGPSAPMLPLMKTVSPAGVLAGTRTLKVTSTGFGVVGVEPAGVSALPP